MPQPPDAAAHILATATLGRKRIRDLFGDYDGISTLTIAV
jgi:hypothetical protein